MTEPMILFQGDSITDCQRDREDADSMGKGYVARVMQEVHASAPGWSARNLGISGHRSSDLRERWERDCLDLSPRVLSLYIGINDTWRRYDRQNPTSTEAYAGAVRFLLESTFARTPVEPGFTLLIEPFVLDVPVGDKAHWIPEDLGAKQEVLRNFASEFGTRFLPLQALFDEACASQPAASLAHDGVHPTSAGHDLVAGAWLEEMLPLLRADFSS